MRARLFDTIYLTKKLYFDVVNFERVCSVGVDVGPVEFAALHFGL